MTTGRRLDRESQSSHSFTVKAETNGVPAGTAYTAILVTLSDLNDHAPKFPRGLYKYSIAEGPYDRPLTLAYIEAEDKDEQGPNSEVRYTLTAEKQGEASNKNLEMYSVVQNNNLHERLYDTKA